jgi:hypothetical protein
VTSTPLDVDGIRFDFDESWSVTKWDDSRTYLEGIHKLNGVLDERPEGTKAVDVIGLRGEVPFLFEVKDFRGFAIDNKHRQLAELPLEVGLKARDTIAGLLGLLASSRGRGLPERWIRAASNPQRPVHVFALLAEDAARPAEANHKREIRALERKDQLKRRLAWLTPRVFVTDPLREADVLARHGVTAQSLQGAGPAR